METIVDFLKRWEQLRLKKYRCAGGIATIGYGHRIRPEESLKDEISLEQAEALLTQDMARANSALERLVKVPLHPLQKRALLSFIFNVGSGAFQRSTLRSKVNRGEHKEVLPEFLKWIWAGSVRPRGLLRRRSEEAALYARGTSRQK